jgi:hypothetical protein
MTHLPREQVAYLAAVLDTKTENISFKQKCIYIKCYQKSSILIFRIPLFGLLDLVILGQMKGTVQLPTS